MDDKELIKRIMGEVRDEKLRGSCLLWWWRRIKRKTTKSRKRKNPWTMWQSRQYFWELLKE
jgi:hypothetical protein